MSVKKFPKQQLTEWVKAYDEGEPSPIVHQEAHGVPGRDFKISDRDLYVKCSMVFKDGENFYWIRYLTMNSYYLSQGAEPCEPFEHLKEDMVDCLQVFPQEVTQTVYKAR